MKCKKCFLFIFVIFSFFNLMEIKVADASVSVICSKTFNGHPEYLFDVNDNIYIKVFGLSNDNAESCAEIVGLVGGSGEGWCQNDANWSDLENLSGWSYSERLWKFSGGVFPPNHYRNFWRNKNDHNQVAAKDIFIGPKNILYKGILNNPNLKLDIYRSSLSNAPVIVYIHSGGWYAGHKDADVNSIDPNKSVPKALSLQGFNVVSINYSLASANNHSYDVPDDGYYPKPLKDINCALRWINKYGNLFDFDISKVYMGGYSSGGHLALLYSLKQSDYYDSNCSYGDTETPFVSRVFSVAGPTNLVDPKLAEFEFEDPPEILVVKHMVDNFMDCDSGYEPCKSKAIEASPVNHVNGFDGSTEYLLISAENDLVVPFLQVEKFYDKLAQINSDYVKKRWYSQSEFDPGDPSYENGHYIGLDKFDEIISITGEFFKNSFSCLGSISSNASDWDEEESLNVFPNTYWSHSFVDSSSKCQFHCNSGYNLESGNCVKKTYNSTDFAHLSDNWLMVGDFQSDVNGDGIVNSRDLGIMMNNWQ